MTVEREAAPLQSYRAYYENGRVITVGNPSIPEGSLLIVTVTEMPAKSRPAEDSPAWVDELRQLVKQSAHEDISEDDFQRSRFERVLDYLSDEV